jgi:hypothetical protein
MENPKSEIRNPKSRPVYSGAGGGDEAFLDVIARDVGFGLRAC